MVNLHAELTALKDRVETALAASDTTSGLEQVRQEFLGKKSAIKTLLSRLTQVELAERPQFARQVNETRDYLEQRIRAAHERISNAALAAQVEGEWIDRSLPGAQPRLGALNPVTEIEERCLSVLRRLGFEVAEGPEVEEEYYNFDALNILRHHPARDMQDTFFVEGGLVLRTHTTSVQSRVLSQHRPPPIKIVSRGRVYRNESVDATHLAMFHQLEGVWLDTGTTFGHLKWVLRFVVQHVYGKEVVFRYKPKFYPYTEPSVGLDIRCTQCSGRGCEACHDMGWVTVIGAGMIHPNVLTRFGYDPDRLTGFAFGWGTTRLAAQFFWVSRVRSIYEQDVRFLRSIRGGDQP